MSNSFKDSIKHSKKKHSISKILRVQRETVEAEQDMNSYIGVSFLASITKEVDHEDF